MTKPTKHKQKCIKKNNSKKEEIDSKFLHDIYTYGVISWVDTKKAEELDLDSELDKSKNAIEAIKSKEGLKTMLAAQMRSIHKLQQTSMAMASSTERRDTEQYYINTAIKLSNTFTQQANTMAKLQGISAQRITVERVDVRHGGQAVVGAINGAGREFIDEK